MKEAVSHSAPRRSAAASPRQDLPMAEIQARQASMAQADERMGETQASPPFEIDKPRREEEGDRLSKERARRQLAEIDAVYATAPVGLCVVDRDLRFVRINERLARLNGASVAEHIGRGIQEMVPDVAAIMVPLLQGVITSGKPLLNNECVSETPALPGKPRTWIGHFYPLTDDSGWVIGINVVVDDITERKEAEEALRHSEQRYRDLINDLERQVEERTAEVRAAYAALQASEERYHQIYDSTADAILVIDLEGRIIEVNDQACRQYGYPREDFIKLRISDIDMPGDAVQAPGRIAVLDEQGHASFEAQHRDAHGHELTVEVRATRIHYDGKPAIMGLCRDITEQKQTQARIEYLAHHDPLTGLPNRSLLTEHLRQLTDHAVHANQLVAVCHLNLDDFKPINDSYGHEVGDALLVELAKRLKGALRQEDEVARVGGDEFAILLTGLDSPFDALEAMHRLIRQVNLPFEVQGHRLHLSASLGLTLFPTDHAGPDALLQHAHEALFKAKASNKGGWHLYDPIQDYEERQRRQLRQEFAQALENDQLLLYYQPKVNLSDGQVVGLEALVRWQHPREGLLAPDRFLPQLKDTPLDIALGEWVITTALAQQQLWREQGIPLAVSVNISPRQIQEASFSEFLARALDRHQRRSEVQLEIEILEIAALEDASAAAQVMRACRDFGVRFSLDDFGTGYSSLAYFHQLPIDIVKIDRHFVRNILDNPEDLAIVEGVVRMAKALPRPVIAEGVESLEIGLLLYQLGCQFAQGYGISRPMPADQVIPWLKEWPSNRPWHNLPARAFDEAASLHLLWRPSFDCGQPVIDAEHRELFQIANRLLDLAMIDPAPDHLIPTLDVLLNHVVNHFAHEEEILRHHGFPDLERHAGLHKALVKRALNLRGEVERGRLTFGQLAEFLSREVVARHMLHEDRAFFPLFAGARDGVVQAAAV